MRPCTIVLTMTVFLLNAQLLRAQAIPKEKGGVSSANTAKRLVTGPGEPMNAALAGGSNASITVRPVAPKTVPPSNYPAGTSIVDTTITLGAIPARVWVETEITGWAPEILKTVQVYIDGDDGDVDGGGYYLPECNGEPVIAGNLYPVIQDCTVNTDCRATISGITTPCAMSEPSRCINRPFGLPPGPKVCEWGFIDRCDPRYLGKDRAHVMAFALDKIVDSRFGISFEPDEIPIDSGPSYLATIVINVPANAKGSYYLDYDESQTFLQNDQFPGQNEIPIAALNEAVIRIPCGSCCVDPNLPSAQCHEGYSQSECNAAGGAFRVFRPDVTCAEDPCQACFCSSNSECDDGDGCTTDICTSCLCSNNPVASWNQATECCNPATGVQGPIPTDTPCQTGGCTLGGSSGIPTYTNLPDGADCIPDDPCYLPGECQDGSCVSEEYAGPDCPKSRFISFDISTGSVASAYRVRMVSLHHPNPPYRGGAAADFSAFEGEYRWVTAPSTYTEAENDLRPIHAAIVGCQPHYQDWSEVDLLHVTGPDVVPSSVYEVQSIAEGLDLENESNYSPPVTINTGPWADAIYPYAPHPTVQPNVPDVAAMVNKFRNVPGSLSKPRGLFMNASGSDIPNLAIELDFSQISATVDSFRGAPYPYAGPASCP